MPYYKKTYRRIFWSFDSHLYFNENSNNLMGVDLHPRYYITPTKLRQALYFSTDPRSIDRGYFRDPDINVYLKNIHDKTDEEIETLFARTSRKPPYGYDSMSAYEEYSATVFSEVQQRKYEIEWEQIEKAGNIITPALGQGLPYAEILSEYTEEQAAEQQINELYNPYTTVKNLRSIL